MKVKHLTLASAGSLLMVGAANAAFLGVEIKSMDHWFSTDHPSVAVRNAYNGGGVLPDHGHGALDAWRIYAVFDSPGGALAAFGATGQEMYLNNVDNGTFYNYTEVTPTYGATTYFDNAPESPFTGNRAALPYDTFAAIGGDVNDGVSFTPPGTFAGDNGGVGQHFAVNWSSDEGTGNNYSWFKTTPVAATQTPNGLFTPNSPHGAATDGRYYVLLFQATVADGKKIEGQFGVNAGADGLQYGDHTFFTTNPTPGTLALLGLGGLVGARRRRKA